MKIIKSKPFTPGRRHYEYLPKFLLCKYNKFLKNLTFNIKRCVGRSSITGHTTIWGRSSGCKKLYRQINPLNNSSLGVILFSFYDPNRSAFVSVYFDFLNYKFSYVLAIEGVVSGSIIISSIKLTDFRLGYRSSLNKHISGSILNSISLNPQKLPQYALAAGTFCQLIQKNKDSCRVRLPSNQIIILSSNCFATLGIVSNVSNNLVVFGKAGRSRLKGFRPKVRGIAMNPVDHPHGGRTNGGCAWTTPWGKPTQNRSTSRSKVKKIYKL
jgi:large subunit ribosomal protein L2